MIKLMKASVNVPNVWVVLKNSALEDVSFVGVSWHDQIQRSSSKKDILSLRISTD